MPRPTRSSRDITPKSGRKPALRTKTKGQESLDHCQNIPALPPMALFPNFLAQMGMTEDLLKQRKAAQGVRLEQYEAMSGKHREMCRHVEGLEAGKRALREEIQAMDDKYTALEAKFAEILASFEEYIKGQEDAQAQRKVREAALAGENKLEKEGLKDQIKDLEEATRQHLTDMSKKECEIHQIQLESGRMNKENAFLNKQLDKIRDRSDFSGFNSGQVQALTQEIAKLKEQHEAEKRSLKVKLKQLVARPVSNPTSEGGEAPAIFYQDQSKPFLESRYGQTQLKRALSHESRPGPSQMKSVASIPVEIHPRGRSYEPETPRAIRLRGDECFRLDHHRGGTPPLRLPHQGLDPRPIPISKDTTVQASKEVTHRENLMVVEL